MLTNTPNIFCMTPHLGSTAAGSHLAGLPGPPHSEWDVGSYSFITYYSMRYEVSYVCGNQYCTLLRNFKCEDITQGREMFSYLVLISRSPALHKTSFSQAELTIHSELINFRAWQWQVPTCWLSLYVQESQQSGFWWWWYLILDRANLVICSLHYLLLSNVKTASNLAGWKARQKIFKISARRLKSDIRPLRRLIRTSYFIFRVLIFTPSLPLSPCKI